MIKVTKAINKTDGHTILVDSVPLDVLFTADWDGWTDDDNDGDDDDNDGEIEEVAIKLLEVGIAIELDVANEDESTAELELLLQTAFWVPGQHWSSIIRQLSLQCAGHAKSLLFNAAVGHNDIAQTIPPEAAGKEAVGLSIALTKTAKNKESKQAKWSFIINQS